MIAWLHAATMRGCVGEKARSRPAPCRDASRRAKCPRRSTTRFPARRVGAAHHQVDDRDVDLQQADRDGVGRQRLEAGGWMLESAERPRAERIARGTENSSLARPMHK